MTRISLVLYIPTWIVCEKANCYPPSRRHANSVPLSWVNEVELGGVFLGVEVSKTLTYHEEVEAMEVKRVALGGNDASVLQYQLHGSIKWKRHHLGPGAHHNVGRWSACVVKFGRWVGREIRGVHTLGFVEEVGLEQGCVWLHKRHIVEGSSQQGVVGALACLVLRAWEQSQSYGEEKASIYGLWDICWEFRGGQAADFLDVIGSVGRVVEPQKNRSEKRQLLVLVFSVGNRGPFVYEQSGGCGVVKGSWAGDVWSSDDGESGVRRFGFGPKKDIGGLPWGEKESFCFKGLHVDCIGFNNGEGVVGNAEKELVVECGIDQTQEIGFTRLHPELECICMKFNVFIFPKIT